MWLGLMKEGPRALLLLRVGGSGPEIAPLACFSSAGGVPAAPPRGECLEWGLV